MKAIMTLTVNPSIDSSCGTNKVRPIHKIRTSDERYDPGGGGINVARVIRILGGRAEAIYLAGGLTGEALNRMIDEAELPHHVVWIEGLTRVSHVVFEHESGHEYRFTPSGPHVTEAEIEKTLDEIKKHDFDYLVASGSLEPSLPVDFYAQVGRLVEEMGAQIILDTSGAPLRAALESGHMHLVKPSIGELEGMLGRDLRTERAIKAAASEIVSQGHSDMVAVTMGGDGAVFASKDEAIFIEAPKIKPKSAVGAGDSFVAAMTYGLAQGREPTDAFAYGVATGTATVLTMGTELCRIEDVEWLYSEITEAQGDNR